MKLAHLVHIEKTSPGHARLEVYTVVNDVKMGTPAIVCSGPEADVQDFADGKIDWAELGERWKTNP